MEKNVEIKPNSGLMKKTKVQLVEIILRKDEREKELLSNIKTLEEYKNRFSLEINKRELKINEYKEHINNLQDQFHCLNEDYRDECDANIEIKEEYKNKINKYKRSIIILCYIILIMIIFIFKLLFI